MVPIEHLGRALATLRDKHNKTQEEVANVAGVTPSMISNYERGQGETLPRVAVEDPERHELQPHRPGGRPCASSAARPSPLHCRNWRIRIESDEYPPVTPSRRPSEIAEPSFDARGRSPGVGTGAPKQAERYVGAMMRLILDLLRLAERPNA